jgi:choline dehydrogenase-like flavoprotein
MTQTFVPRFLRAGGRLLPGARVDQIRQDGGKWTLTCRHFAGRLQIKAGCLFLCAGAVQTPLLLRRNGITRNVGNSLGLHPTLKVVAQFSERVNALDMGVPVHQVKEFAPRMSFGCSISTPAYLALGLLEHPATLKNLPQTWPWMANYYAMIAGEGRGSVRAVPGYGDPLVRYRLARQDLSDLASGVRRLCELLFAAKANSLFVSIAGSPQLTSPADLAKLPQSLPNGAASLMTIHLFSSCPMGEDKSKSAANSFGRLHGFKNLYIADASLLCGPPGVNPQGSIMALARRNALRFLEDHRSGR